MSRVARACLIAMAVVVAATATAAAQDRDPTSVVVFVYADDMSPAARATVITTVENALERDRRLDIRDKDLQLARMGGAVPLDVVSEARGLLSTGEALLSKGRTADALPRLTTAATQLERVLPYISKKELARAQFLVGAANAILGNRKAARSWFMRLLTWREGYAVDTSLSPGKVLPAWEEAVAAMKKLPSGGVDVKSSPAGTMVYVDGRFVGFSPTRAKDIVVGTHYVTVLSPGYQRTIEVVQVAPDKTTRVRAQLQASPNRSELDDIRERIRPKLGAAELPVELDALQVIIGVDHAVFITVADGDYSAYVYDLNSGRRLAHATAKAGDDMETDFVELGDALYTEAFRVDVAPPPPKPQKRKRKAAPTGTPFYRTWWFWTGVGVTAAAVSGVLLWPESSGDGAACPAGHVCGDVVFRF